MEISPVIPEGISKTAFGYYTPDRETLFCRQLLYDEDDVIGYETGLSVLNRLGLL